MSLSRKLLLSITLVVVVIVFIVAVYQLSLYEKPVEERKGYPPIEKKLLDLIRDKRSPSTVTSNYF